MIESEQKHKSATKGSFIKGLVTGVLVIVVLGGVYMAGASKNGGFNFGTKKLTGTSPTVPTAPTAPTAPGAPTGGVGSVAPISADDHIRGSADADIFLVEYSDYECPFCARFHPTMNQVLEAYGNKVAWVYRHFPLSSIHPGAQKKAEASECINELGGNDKFWEYTDIIFERSSTGGAAAVPLTSLKGIAEEIGINGDKFQSCLDGGKYASKVAQDLAGGQQAGVTGTPGTVIITKDGPQQIIPGALPFTSIQATIDSLL